jgi:formylglycine-generating enzyme required for sulfatase activity
MELSARKGSPDGDMTVAKKESKKPVARPTRKAAQRGKAAKAKPPSPAASAAAAPNATLAKPEIKKIHGLLKSKTSDGVTLGLSLLESLGATTADYEAVFTETVIKSVLNGWVAESWGAVAKALVPHGAVSEVFQRLAEERYLKRPRKHSDFGGLLRARLPLARTAFLATWGDASASAKPFIDLVDIPAGLFIMGSPEEEDRSNDENQVQVRITKPFGIGRTVVTQGQWREVMGSEPWRYPSTLNQKAAWKEIAKGLEKNHRADDFPAVYVKWDDAVLFCQTLTGLERETGQLTASQSYRLPTEAQWEYACRAGTTTAYSFGDDPNDLDEHGWYREYNDHSGWRLYRVALKKPNPWGLYDMHGNVLEWCADWKDEWASSSPTGSSRAGLAGGDDPHGPAAGTCRVLRGGSWSCNPPQCRSAYRNFYRPSSLGYTIGFRVVLSLQ